MEQDISTRSYASQVYHLRHLAQIALQAYALDNPRLSLLKHGENTTFYVEAPTVQAGRRPHSSAADRVERLVLRIHRPGYQCPTSIQSELAWLAALHHDTDLIVPEALPADDGSFITLAASEQIPEARACVLFRWIDGRFLKPGAGLSVQAVGRLGRFVAQLHQQTEHFVPPPGFVRPHWDWDRLIGHGVTFYPGEGSKPFSKWGLTAGASWLKTLSSEQGIQDGGLLEEAAECIREHMLALGRERELVGLIHADLNHGNYLFHHQDVRAIDFDDCGWGHYLYDIAVPLFWLCRLPNFAEMRSAFFEQYRTIRPMLIEDGAYLDLFIAARCLVLIRWFTGRADNPKIRSRTPGFLQNAFQIIKDFMTREYRFLR